MCKVSTTTPYGCAVPRLRSCLSDSSIDRRAAKERRDQDVPLRRTRSVSFDETVHVHVIAPLDAFAKREVFYQAVDYRRFRSEAVVETLDAQVRQVQQWTRIVDRIVRTLLPSKQQQLPYPLVKAWQYPSPPFNTSMTDRACKAAKIAMATSPASAKLVIQQLAFTGI